MITGVLGSVILVACLWSGFHRIWSQRPVRRTVAMLRFAAMLMALLLFSTGAVRGTPETNGVVPGLSNAEFVKWVITQGGYLGVILIGGWSWRRDFVRGLLSARTENAQLVEALKTMSAAMAAHTETARQQTAAMHDIEQVIQNCRALQVYVGQSKG